ncbi:MAG: polysaccharide biosynthesis C-terminal domain-containing protein, partial [Leeuwenhoekiella sp.]
YGLVGFILSAATILMPIMAFGVHNTLVKFYSAYKNEEQDQFLTMMLVLPLFVIIPGALLTIFAYQLILDFLASENDIVRPYAYLIFIVAFAMAYFEIFYSWSKVQFKSVFGNFMNEVFHRLGVMVLLILFSFKLFTTIQFVYALCGVYLLRMLIMMLYAFKQRKPIFVFKIPKAVISILKYSLLIIVAGSIAVMILEIDMFMIGKMVPIENVAYYSVAIYIAAVIAVPSRAMHQITYPLTAEYLNLRKFTELKELYKKSSLTLFVISGLIFILIICNIKQLYLLLDPAYSNGLEVVILISMAKLLDNLMGNNNAILYNSDYYRLVLILGVILVIIAVVLNIIFIPWLGINGAAIATFIASVGYCLAKIVVVHSKFKMQPFTRKSGLVAFLLLGFIICFYFWDFSLNPFFSIGLKSSIITAIYISLVYQFQISSEINTLIVKGLELIKSRLK